MCGIRKRDSFDIIIAESPGLLEERISIRDAEILSVGKIAEFAKFARGERRKSPDLVSDKQTAQWAFAASSPR